MPLSVTELRILMARVPNPPPLGPFRSWVISGLVEIAHQIDEHDPKEASPLIPAKRRGWVESGPDDRANSTGG